MEREARSLRAELATAGTPAGAKTEGAPASSPAVASSDDDEFADAAEPSDPPTPRIASDASPALAGDPSRTTLEPHVSPPVHAPESATPPRGDSEALR